ncbi:unnamed protein product [Ostreobium quekettii]|uniref:UNC-50 family protein n=1 Tax=Ostreobium quekettii TaxID=121088 RepID=A0A8S1IZA1_9CHLO|nr:unnamed protein product [Ostreobium quekettii]|eukprot:evm.model.scf_560.3 EVM.evm.TU.scf_560.3   scf_560:58708-59466(-)
MLPTSSERSRRGAPNRTYHSMSTYLRRIVKPKQMDVEYTLWLMLQLCLSPKTAYRHAAYHKQTKNQWCRDDPAYLVVCCLFVAFSAAGYCVAFGTSFWGGLAVTAYAVFVEFLGLGALIATLAWAVANRFLRKKLLPSHAVEQRVEWMYAFDVQCNSFFPLFLLLHVVQFLLLPLLLANNVLGPILSNALHAVAFSYYHYLNFLGYSALPFLEGTELFLYPVALVLLAIPFAIVFAFNPTAVTLRWYLTLTG